LKFLFLLWRSTQDRDV